jgi:hypothetical protein
MAAKKKPFNKYTLTEAYQFLHLTRLTPWNIPFNPIEPTKIFGAFWIRFLRPVSSIAHRERPFSFRRTFRLNAWLNLW